MSVVVFWYRQARRSGDPCRQAADLPRALWPEWGFMYFPRRMIHTLITDWPSRRTDEESTVRTTSLWFLDGNILGDIQSFSQLPAGRLAKRGVGVPDHPLASGLDHLSTSPDAW